MRVYPDTPNFSIEELKCPCCNVCEMDYEFMVHLQELRDKCGFPLKVTSGYRCEIHNQEVSRHSRNQHTQGLAVDISMQDRYQRYKLLKNALDIEYFKDIAIAGTFIHIGRGQNENGVGVYGQ